MDDDSFRRFARAAIEAHSRTPVDDRFWPAFARMIHYQPGGFDDDKHFHDLASRLAGLDKDMGGGSHHVFYLSTPSSFFPVIVRRMGNAKLNRGSAGVRIVIEKPFGHDLAVGARAEPATVHACFEESQVFRIDHYLGKETVQNILRLPLRQRDLRADVEPRLRRPRADHGGRATSASRTAARFYEETGVAPRHGAEPPAAGVDAGGDGAAGGLRGRGACATRRLKCCARRAGRCAFEDVVRGQYAAGYVGGRAWPATAKEPSVAADSRRRRTSLRSWRSTTGAGRACRSTSAPASGWPSAVTEVAVQFKRPPHLPFSARGVGAPRGELAGAADPAGRGHLAAVRRQGARRRPSRSAA